MNGVRAACAACRRGPPAKSGPASVMPSGWWELSDDGAGMRVKLVMTPTPGGVFKLMAPLMRLAMRKANARAMDKLKSRLEGGVPPGASPGAAKLHRSARRCVRPAARSSLACTGRGRAPPSSARNDSGSDAR